MTDCLLTIFFVLRAIKTIRLHISHVIISHWLVTYFKSDSNMQKIVPIYGSTDNQSNYQCNTTDCIVYEVAETNNVRAQSLSGYT